MSQPCAIATCKRVSRTLCYGCNQNFCREHMVEHDLSLNSQLNPLSDEINALGERLKSINLENTIGDSHQKLEQWRLESHKKIDQFYEQKCQELDQLISEKINEQQEKLLKTQAKIDELIREQQVTRQDINE